MKKFLSLVGVFALSLLVLASCAKKYTINFDVTPDFDVAGGYTGTTVESVKFEEGVAFEAPVPTWEGLSFCGWYKDSGSFEEEFNFEAPEAGNITVYAKWRVEIKLETNCDIKLDSIYNYPYETIELPAMDKDGYAMVGWYADAEFTKAVPTLTPESNLTVYAKWLKLDEASKVSVSNWVIGAEENPAYTETKNADGSVTFKATDKKLEYSLVKANLGANLKGYTVIVMNVKGTGEILPKLQEGGIQVVEKKFELTGEMQKLVWVFDSKVLENSGQSASEMLLFFLNPGKPGAGSEVTIYNTSIYRTLEGEAVSGSAIIFNSKGGSLVNPIVAPAGSEVAAPKAPKKDGFVFAGWYTNADCEGDAYTFTTMPEENIELYAKWDLAAYFSVDLINDAYRGLDEGSYGFEVVDGVLKIKKLTADSWKFAVGSATGANIAGATYLHVTLKGNAGDKIVFKVNDQGGSWEKAIDCDGTVQSLSFSLEGLAINPNAVALCFFVNGETGTATEIEVYELTYSNYARPNSLINDSYRGLDEGSYGFEVVDGVLKIKKLTADSWKFAVGTATGSVIAGTSYLNVTLKGNAGDKIVFKVNDQGGSWEKAIDCDGTVQSFSFSLEGLVVNQNAVALCFFVNGETGTATEIEVYQLEYSCVANPLSLIDDSYRGLDEGSYAFEVVDGVLKIKKLTADSWKFAVGTITGASLSGYTSFNITLKGNAGDKIVFKVNDQGGSWEKAIDCDGTVQSFTYSITELAVNPNAVAICLFVNGETGTATEIEVYSLNFAN